MYHEYYKIIIQNRWNFDLNNIMIIIILIKTKRMELLILVKQINIIGWKKIEPYNYIIIYNQSI